MKPKLSPSMTVTQFDNGYWYATELKDFAKAIEIPSAGKLRKDEFERAIMHFLTTGETGNLPRRNLLITGTRDVELGLRLDLRVNVYTNDRETKAFLEREARKLAPGLKRKSGARYRLNRWREEQLTAGVAITYGDVVREYVRLSQLSEPFAKIPHGRYINFTSDFLAAEKGAAREQVLEAWAQLKTLDIPKDYPSWKAWQSKER